MPEYSDKEELKKVKEHLKQNKELISLDRILDLKKELIEVEEGKSFLMIGGNCAENLNEPQKDNVEDIIQILQEMKKRFGKKSLLIGRMAGQYAKPRSNDTETINGIDLPVFMGEIVNSLEFTKDGRTARPLLMIKAYQQCLNTLKTINNKVWTAHEALLLDFEETLIRKKDNITYLSSTGLPWIGERTRNVNSAHTEFLRGVVNPIGIKVGPNCDVEDLVKIIKTLNPQNEKGKIILTIRMGCGKMKVELPKIINSVQLNDLNVIWISDPVHGNGKTCGKYKTRYLKDIETELLEFNEVCKECNVYNGGFHIEIGGGDIEECIGLSATEENLGKKYETLCDPRLNREQCLYLIEKIKEKL
jgi:3-deoxy-7-phosphoheptulonate synthase